jgi:hypothetical protein
MNATVSFVPEKSTSSHAANKYVAGRTRFGISSEWLAGFIGVVLLAALLDTAQTSIHLLRTGRDVAGALHALPNAIGEWFVRAAIIPAAVIVGNYLPVEQPHRARNLFVHFMAALALTPLVLGLSVPFMSHSFIAEWLPRVPPSRRNLAPFAIAIFLHFVTTFALYWLALGVSQARRSHRRYLERLHAAADLERRSNELVINLSYARLSAMKTQVNPEFISRSLAAIGQLASEGKHRSVIATTTRLARLLRSIVDETHVLDRLISDLNLLNDYLRIEHVRLGDRLRVRYRMPTQLLNVEIPTGILRLLSQMMIESAVGPVQLVCGGCVRANRAAVYLEGPIPEHARSEFEAAVAGLRERLNQLYGSRHALVTRHRDGRARVTLTAPFNAAG